jgi:hypothetical protein
VNGQTALFFPAFDGAFISIKERGNFFPGVDPAIFRGARHRPGRHMGLNLSRKPAWSFSGAEVESV